MKKLLLTLLMFSIVALLMSSCASSRRSGCPAQAALAGYR